MRRLVYTLILIAVPFALAGAQEAEYELVTFDVSTLCTPRASASAPHLGPTGLVLRGEHFETEPHTPLEIDAIADIVRDTISPATWDTGGDVQGRQGGFLLVKAPRAVARQIGDLLAVLESAHGRRVRYSVASHRLPLTAWAMVLSGTLTPDATRTAEASGVAWPGVPTAVSVTNRVSWLADYDVEIATNTAIADPVTASALEGLALDLTAWPTCDGKSVLLDVFVQTGRFQRPIRELALAPPGSNAPGLPQLGNVQLPEYRFLASSTIGLVKIGGSLLVPVAVQGGVEVVEVKVHGIEDGRQSGPVIPLSTFTARPRINRLAIDNLTPVLYRGREAAGKGAMVFGNYQGRRLVTSAENMMDLITHNVEPDAWESDGVRINVSSDGLYFSGDAELGAEIREFVQRREAAMLRPIRVDISLWSVSGSVEAGPTEAFKPLDGKIVCGGSVVSLAGRESFLVAGGVADHVADYEVEVAEGACIAKPVISRTFEGLAATIAARLTSSGHEVEVDLGILLARRHRSEPLDSGADAIGPVELVEVGEVRMNQTVRVVDGGSYVLPFGPDQADPLRSLVLVIRPAVE